GDPDARCATLAPADVGVRPATCVVGYAGTREPDEYRCCAGSVQRRGVQQPYRDELHSDQQLSDWWCGTPGGWGLHDQHYVHGTGRSTAPRAACSNGDVHGQRSREPAGAGGEWAVVESERAHCPGDIRGQCAFPASPQVTAAYNRDGDT